MFSILSGRHARAKPRRVTPAARRGYTAPYMTTPPEPHTLVIHSLENDTLRLDVTPTLGASIVNLCARTGDTWTPIMRDTTPELLARGSSSYLSSFTLAPYSNRIPGGRFAFEGRELHLKPNTREGNAQHGDVRNREHRALEVGATRATYEFDARRVPDFNYPEPVVLHTTFELVGNAAVQTLTLTNVGSARVPAGVGVHPYFNRHVGGAADVTLQFGAAGVYLTDTSLIPQHGMESLPPALDFREGRVLGDLHLDTGFGGYEGRTILAYAGTPYRTVIESDAVFTHLILFTAPDDTLAVEPVTHATNAFNLHEQGVAGTGFTVLAPGESLSGSVTYRFEQNAR